MYIVQNIGRNPSIDNALGISDNVEWIGNEVACGVGMQRIDIMVSKSVGPLDRVVMPIESYLSIKLQTDDNSLIFTNISY